jgi:hypothetical protein
MEEPLNSINYFIAGYSVIFGIMLIYLVSLIVRWRNLREDEKILSALERKDE